ncbi:MAG: carboxylesterase [Bdellovibrionales bacterium RIFCSPHIGHO2_01_FULL_40_29]|nr:MAG: carboxylesterase [Bdellovibrionales bacterium RIFCSPHIGHO2_01_FULL_40_29]OFZ34140.1 MAG: carboxylesterase [Bdellovibrionales bacterium RIFCSPHIGHO2_02_FULL_40_15]
MNSATKISYDVFPNTIPTTTVFLHGNLSSNRWWIPSVEMLKAKYATISDKKGSIVCVEFRGCGKSSDPKSESEVTMQNFANDFIMLIRSMNWGPVNLVGHSTGGLIAAMMLAAAPELFNKAYLLDPVGAEGVKFDEAMIQAFDQMKVDKNLTAAIIGSTIYNNDATTSFFKDIIVEDAFRSVKAVGHLVLKAIDGLDVRSQLKEVTHPVKVVHGEFDQLLSRVESEKLSQLFKNGQFEVLMGCGHCANVENPKQFTQSLSDFLFV